MIRALDHLVLTVRDLDATIDFYTRHLGLQAMEFGDGRQALHFGAQKINLHTLGAAIEPHAVVPQPGSADLCFLTDEPIDDITARLRQNGVDVFLGPVPRTGASGRLTSIYLRDPDGNLVELANSAPESK